MCLLGLVNKRSLVLSSYVMMSDHVEQADEEPVQGQSAVTPTPSVSHTGEGSTRKI